jgi:hypothetical protein
MRVSRASHGSLRGHQPLGRDGVTGGRHDFEHEAAFPLGAAGAPQVADSAPGDPDGAPRPDHHRPGALHEDAVGRQATGADESRGPERHGRPAPSGERAAASTTGLADADTAPTPTVTPTQSADGAPAVFKQNDSLIFRPESSEDYDFDLRSGWDNTTGLGGNSTQRVNGKQLWFFSHYLKLDASQSLTYSACRDATGYIGGGGYYDRRPFVDFVAGDCYFIKTQKGRIALKTFIAVGVQARREGRGLRPAVLALAFMIFGVSGRNERRCTSLRRS